jgi:hypothetical protein
MIATRLDTCAADIPLGQTGWQTVFRGSHSQRRDNKDDEKGCYCFTFCHTLLAQISPPMTQPDSLISFSLTSLTEP